MEITGIEPLRYQDRVDIEVSFSDGTKCTYLIPGAMDRLTMVVSSDLTPEKQQLTVVAAEKWVTENSDKLAELLAR